MAGILELFWASRSEVAQVAAAHLALVGGAVILAALIGIPLGVLASRSAPVERVALLIANALQTVPSLALLGLLLIVFQRIGTAPALAALVLYALLPILQGTVLGLRSVDRGVLDAARGIGMTDLQRLKWVEFPLAAPVLIGGLRLATVASVGMATIATAIGAKGLGIYIFRGLQTIDPRYVLLGSIPAAALALLCDAALHGLEERFDPRRRAQGGWRSRLAIPTLAALGLLALWGVWPERSGDRPKIVVGSKNFSEANLLGHMVADLIEADGRFRVERTMNLDGFACYQGLRTGNLDVYVEYTGTVLTALLKQPPVGDPARALALVREGLGPQGIDVLDPLGFENTFAILVRRDDAARLDLAKLSDLKARGRGLRPGFGTEFMNRPDGYPGLVEAYQLAFDRAPVEMDLNLLYRALADGSIDLAAGNSTDGRIDSYKLAVLDDDRRYFPPYEAVPLARSATLRRYPAVGEALAKLAGRLDAPTMRRLNQRIDGEGRDPAEVAREFLTSAGLLPGAAAPAP